MSRSQLEPYLSFPGNANEALDFYAQCFDSQPDFVSQYKDIPEPDAEMFAGVDPELILHASIRLGSSQLMVSDDSSPTFQSGGQVAVTWSTDDEEELKRVWNHFVEGGSKVEMELEPSFFSPLFGAVTDPFGIHWMLMMYDPDESQWTPE